MFPNFVTAFPMMAAQWQSQLTSWNEFSRMLNDSMLKAWDTNLQLGQTVFGNAGRPVPAATGEAAFTSSAPRQALDSMAAWQQDLTRFATSMQAGLAPFTAAWTPAPPSGTPDSSNGPKTGEDATRAADDEKWRVAEQAYLDAAGQDMHAEGHAQEDTPAAPKRPT